MTDAGLPYGAHRSRTYNSRLAQELAAWADEEHAGSNLHEALYKAYFVDHQNISDADTLVRLAVKAQLNEEEAREVLETRRFSQKVDADWQHARQSGITGVPTFWAKDLYVVGCQPYDILERFVNHLKTLGAEE